MAIFVTPINDIDLIRSAICHPRIWPHVSDDGSASVENFLPVISESLVYLGAFDGEKFCGLFMIHPHNLICWEVHTCLLPSAWGMKSQYFATLCINWAFENTTCQRLITNVPEKNKLAKRLAMSVGMKIFGINENSFLKNGKALNQVMLGISKEQP